MSFIEKIHDFIRHNRLMDKNKKYLVALSGGADSVSLILALKELGFDVDAVHCNFHLRGKESERDEQFCISLCKRKALKYILFISTPWNMPHYIKSVSKWLPATYDMPTSNN